jgi:hypothetical protein
MGQEEAGTAGNTDVLVYHGATDAPTVDVYEPYAGLRAVDDISYGEFQGYLGLANADYSLQVQTSDGRSAVAEYAAPLETLGLSDSALVVLASGFLTPASNSDGPAFGLYVALPMGGELIPLPAVEVASARVQVIHNSADAAAATVDVWYNDVALLPGFAFRTASPFIDVTAGTEFDITIQPPSSADTTNGLWRKSYTLMGDETYVLVANGIVSASGYMPATPFDIHVNAMGQEEAGTAGNTDVLVYHGATDAPTVDVYEPYAGLRAVDDISYGEFQGYLGLANADYSLQVQTSDGRTAVAEYAAPLETLGLSDSALVVLASGFLTPTSNSDGPAFGLYVALPMGGDLIALPSVDVASARVQVIHNSADAAAATVDVWYNDVALLPGFAFRTASPFIDVTAGTEFDITIQPPSSADTTNGLWRKSYTLMGDETYVLVANGIVSASGYSPATAFDIYVSAMGREEAGTAGNTDILVFHGSTDAPTVDIYEASAGELINDLAYGEYDDDYLELPTADYTLQVRDETGNTVVASYSAPLATLALDDSALVAVASGFLDPSNNSDGAAFGIWVALPMGGNLIELPSVPVSTNDLLSSKISLDIWPNPASRDLSITYTLDEASDIQLDMLSITGQILMSLDLGPRSSGSYNETIDVSSLKEGLYLLRFKSGNDISTSKIKVAR